MNYGYILKSLKDGKQYVGLTNNVIRRIEEHNHGKVPATKGRQPLMLLRIEEFEDRSEAAKQEKFYKSGIGRKELKRLLDH